jgi:hypothetical protein
MLLCLYANYQATYFIAVNNFFCNISVKGLYNEN